MKSILLNLGSSSYQSSTATQNINGAPTYGVGFSVCKLDRGTKETPKTEGFYWSRAKTSIQVVHIGVKVHSMNKWWSEAFVTPFSCQILLVSIQRNNSLSLWDGSSSFWVHCCIQERGCFHGCLDTVFLAPISKCKWTVENCYGTSHSFHSGHVDN